MRFERSFLCSQLGCCRLLDCSELVLRILADDSHSLMRFGTKFGAPFESVEGLMKLAKQLQLRVVGIAFHIGSGCFSTKAHSAAVELARQCFDVAERIGLPRLRLLDIGGGFPGDLQVGVRPDGSPGFECMAGALREAFARHFPEERYPELQIIGEPGRYFAKSWATLFTAVVGKRSVVQPPAPVASGVASSSVLAATTSAGGPRQQARALHTEPEKKPRFLYYITDGVVRCIELFLHAPTDCSLDAERAQYGSFNCLIFDHAVAVPVPAKRLLSDAGVSPSCPPRSPPRSAPSSARLATRWTWSPRTSKWCGRLLPARADSFEMLPRVACCRRSCMLAIGSALRRWAPTRRRRRHASTASTCRSSSTSTRCPKSPTPSRPLCASPQSLQSRRRDSCLAPLLELNSRAELSSNAATLPPSFTCTIDFPGVTARVVAFSSRTRCLQTCPLSLSRARASGFGFAPHAFLRISNVW